ncbi:MAG: carboxymuconolactone decarboxylase family protein [Calditrichaeota bacterium]|nr:carboxymuconolactone decarboxylase family protein [Calditrichota bacterium]
MPEHPLLVFEKLDPEVLAHLRRMDDFVFASGALPRKVKLLIAMAFDAAHGAVNGVRALATAAMQEGATPVEIAEVLRVAGHLAGVGAFYTAASALREVVE